MSGTDEEVLDAGQRLLLGKLKLEDYLVLLEQKSLINKLDVQVVYMLSWLTGDPITRTEIVDIVGSDLKYIARCVKRVCRVLTNYDDRFEKIAMEAIGVMKGRLIWPEESEKKDV